MFALRPFSEHRIRQVLESQKRSGYSYRETGATAAILPPGYRTHHERFNLGRGAAVFERARSAVREWKMFDIEWLRVWPPEKPIAAGTIVGVAVRHFGFWSLNVSRIVYVIDEPRRYGFAYGTLAEHAESGEERFLVEWGEDDTVWYDVLLFSRERHPLARIAFPLSRALQARFRRDSGAAMQRAAARDG